MPVDFAAVRLGRDATLCNGHSRQCVSERASWHWARTAPSIAVCRFCTELDRLGNGTRSLRVHRSRLGQNRLPSVIARPSWPRSLGARVMPSRLHAAVCEALKWPVPQEGEKPMSNTDQSLPVSQKSPFCFSDCPCTILSCKLSTNTFYVNCFSPTFAIRSGFLMFCQPNTNAGLA
jgi:hypothetical protein